MATIPTSGPLSISSVASSFGDTAPYSLSSLYAGAGYVPSGTTGTGGAVPSSGVMSLSAFFGAAIPIVGPLFGWGTDTGAGELGQITGTGGFSTPVQIGTLSDWTILSAGMHVSAGIKTDGSLWIWGQNTQGALGQNDTVSRSSPIQLGSLTDWADISFGIGNGTYATAYGIKTDGTLWSWGYNVNGSLGSGTASTSRSSPVQVGALTNWAEVVGGNSFALARKTDGTLWSWGLNTSGQLGSNTVTARSSPVQVGALTNWAQLSAGGASSAAVKTDGTLWTWGNNSSGQLGSGTTTNRSSPVQVGALTNWAKVLISSFAVGLKTDGTLWSWGLNTNGQLGLGDTTNRSSPVQIGSLTDWSDFGISGNGNAVVALKTDGTVWAWGSGTNGMLGNGNTTSRSSPVQVGALNTWTAISVGAFHTLALK